MCLVHGRVDAPGMHRHSSQGRVSRSVAGRGKRQEKRSTSTLSHISLRIYQCPCTAPGPTPKSPQAGWGAGPGDGALSALRTVWAQDGKGQAEFESGGAERWEIKR